MVEHILLEQEQKDLLCKFVEAVRKVPREKREKFYVLESFDGTEILHPGWEGEENTVYKGDVEALGRENLIAITYNSDGNLKFDVTPLGFKYYEEIKKKDNINLCDIDRINSFKHLLHEVIINKNNMGKAVLWHELQNRLPTGITDLELETAIQELVDKNYIISEPGPGARTRFIAGPSFSVWSIVPEEYKSNAEVKVGMDKTKVFVVHGRNIAIRDNIFQFLRTIKLDPIEWNQAIIMTGKPAPFVGEVLEVAFSNAQAVIVLLTGDDEVRLRDHLLNKHDPDYEYENKLMAQARPNVLFEAWMAFGTHPNRTILIEFGIIKKFSDIAGRHVLHMNNSLAKRQELSQRLQVAGCQVDITGIDWHKAGDFGNSIRPHLTINKEKPVKEKQELNE